jgi:hypothetical protein
MLPREEVAMGFLDKLLGRNKDTPEVDPFIGDERRTDPTESPLDEAEERVTDARDEVLGIEGQIPPGTS